jgi:hypothetical protein
MDRAQNFWIGKLMKKIKVLYIGGYGRSGSTLLDRLLGLQEGCFSVGEMAHIWERGVRQNQLCGCGKPFSDCEFWERVFKSAFGGIDGSLIDRVQELKKSVERMRYIPFLLSYWKPKKFAKDLEEYKNILSRLYASIQEISGCRVIIDSSKIPVYLFILQQCQGLDVIPIHLVRDSRAVAYSWLRKQVRPEVHWQNQLMPRHNIVLSSAMWLLMNMQVTIDFLASSCYKLVKYETLVKSPQKTISGIMEKVRFFPAMKAIDPTEEFIFPVSHTISGNPMRFQTGKITIKEDMEWKQKMPFLAKAIITTITLPLLVMYGYLKK